MVQRFLVDKIMHAFVSDGNLHIVLGLSTGLVNEQGDIKDPQVTIIIPNTCAETVSGELSKAINHFGLHQENGKKEISEQKDFESEILGPAIELKLSVCPAESK